MPKHISVHYHINRSVQVAGEDDILAGSGDTGSLAGGKASGGREDECIYTINRLYCCSTVVYKVFHLVNAPYR